MSIETLVGLYREETVFGERRARTEIISEVNTNDPLDTGRDH